ncbi:protein of unknown function [Rhodovastum atsumiense]|uniref:aquaporin n=1 Tax=Rhodovastum atsumiense TaxID=504468 RepID=UPI00193BF775|nr:aquaporin [Rhodovastum atsumiense]CAH2601819.1 protein of unknown function [Rhodovastum atsumiense]
MTVAIYATRHLCCAHLNPAVSIAMVPGRRMPASLLPTYLAGQFLGACLAALAFTHAVEPILQQTMPVCAIVGHTARPGDLPIGFGTRSRQARLSRPSTEPTAPAASTGK